MNSIFPLNTIVLISQINKRVGIEVVEWKIQTLLHKYIRYLYKRKFLILNETILLLTNLSNKLTITSIKNLFSFI